MQVVSVVNQKGGVGKTTTVVNLASAFAVAGHRVLLVDLDPQGNATSGVGVLNPDHGTYSAFFNLAPLDSCISRTFLSSLEVMSSSEDLCGAEVELVPLENREFFLKNIFSALRKTYDFVIIDCPPSLGLLTVNALAASSRVIIPVQCEFYALEGLSRLLSNIGFVQSRMNPLLSIWGVLMTLFDKRCLLNQQVMEDVQNHLKDQVFPIVIPRSIRLAEAASHGQPAIFYDRKSSGSMAYLLLARFLLTGKRENEF